MYDYEERKNPAPSWTHARFAFSSSPAVSKVNLWSHLIKLEKKGGALAELGIFVDGVVQAGGCRKGRVIPRVINDPGVSDLKGAAVSGKINRSLCQLIKPEEGNQFCQKANNK